MVSFTDLPIEVMTLVFDKLPLAELDRIRLLLDQCQDTSSHIFHIVDTLRHSRIIVTNEWKGDLTALIKSKQIVPQDQLGYYRVMSVFEFEHRVKTLIEHFSPLVRNPKQIIFAIGNDAEALEILSVLRCTAKCFRNIPEAVLPFMNNFGVFLIPDSSLFPSSDRDIHISFFSKMLKCHEIFKNVTQLRLEAHHDSPLDLGDEFLDFSKFLNLHSLILCNLKSHEVSKITFPEHLTNLLLVGNCITSIDEWKLGPQLKHVDLSCNNIKSIDGLVFPKGLKIFKAHGNQLESLQRLPSEIFEMDISNNNFSNFHIRFPAKLKILYTDYGQYYSMPSDLRQNLLSRRVVILH